MAEILMKEKLAAFVAQHSVLAQEWGKVDCCLVLADWGIWLGERDTASDLRGSYSTNEGCRRVVRAAGGLIPLVRRCTDLAHWRAIDHPVVGAVGVIGSASRLDRQFGAIFDGRDWLVRLESGFVKFKARPLAIWRKDEACL